MKKNILTAMLWGAICFGALANDPAASHRQNVEAILAKEVNSWTQEDVDHLQTELVALRKANWEGMTKEERKLLKKELREAKREVKKTTALDGGVYLSASALLIIILVLIILL